MGVLPHNVRETPGQPVSEVVGSWGTVLQTPPAVAGVKDGLKGCEMGTAE